MVEKLLTILNLFLHTLVNRALGRLLRRLHLQRLASVTRTPCIQRPLQGIALPAKEVIAVLTIASGIAHGVDKGLGAIGRPVVLVVEGAGIPHTILPPSVHFPA